MGKKLKKDEKAAPTDIFETLQIDSKEACTSVLLLKSEEEPVIRKAAQSIYNFANKCDSNREILQKLNVVQPLLDLLFHNELSVKCNCMMALGVLSENTRVRYELRNRPKAIQTIVDILSAANQTPTVLLEYATLCLSYMSIEYVNKFKIIEANGIENVCKMLTHGDPDVVKNSVETMANLLLDYNACKALRNCGCLIVLLDLINSEYSVIQKLALIALERAAAEEATRAELRSLDTPNILVNFVYNKRYKDLYPTALSTLSSLMIDLDTVNQMIADNSLNRLKALMLDQTSMEESTSPSKNAIKAKKRTKSVSKKNAGAAGKKKEKDKSVKIETTPVIEETFESIVEFKEESAKCLSIAAKSCSDVRRVLNKNKIEKIFVHLLKNNSPIVQKAGAYGLAAMAEFLPSRQSAGDYGATEILCGLLSSSSTDLKVKEAASVTLSRLTLSVQPNCKMVAKFGLKCFMNLLSDELGGSTHTMICSTVIILTNLSNDEHIRNEMIMNGAVEALIGQLKSENSTVKCRSTNCIAALCSDKEARLRFIKQRYSFQSLFNLLLSKDDDVQRSACWAISILGEDYECACNFGNLGAVDLLYEMSKADKVGNAFTESALAVLLRYFLPAKYSLTDRLDKDDFIMDGFYDPGKKTHKDEFKANCPPLSFFQKQEIRPENRAVILINTKTNNDNNNTTTSATLHVGNQQQQQQQRDLLLAESTKSEYKMSLAIATAAITAAMAEKPKRNKEWHVSNLRQRLLYSEENNYNNFDKDLQMNDDLGTNMLLSNVDSIPSIAEDSPPKMQLPTDENLRNYLCRVEVEIRPLSSRREQVVKLAVFVANCMGGAFEHSESIGWELTLSGIRYESKSNVVPIGNIKQGTYCHRALLFKVLADRLLLKVNLVRGVSNRVWNEIVFLENGDGDGDGLHKVTPHVPVGYIIDLMHVPGRLMKINSMEAISYISYR